MRAPSDELLWRLDEDALDLLDEAWEETLAWLQGIGAETILELARTLLHRETVLGAEFAKAAEALTRSS